MKGGPEDTPSQYCYEGVRSIYQKPTSNTPLSGETLRVSPKDWEPGSLLSPLSTYCWMMQPRQYDKKRHTGWEGRDKMVSFCR